MKFLCSILVLAGVIALNDAFPSSENNIMRISNDMLLMKELKLLIANRSAASSVQCSQVYLNGLTLCLDNYNGRLQACEDEEKNLTYTLKKEAKEKIKKLKSNMLNTCSDECPSEGEGNSKEGSEFSNEFDCIEQLSLKTSRNLSDISLEASNSKVALQKSIDDTKGMKDVCDQESVSYYTKESQKMEDEYKKCMQK